MSHFTDPWHFARPELAQAYLQCFDISPSSAWGLFGAATLAQIKTLLEADEVTATMPRGALRRLTGPRLQLLARVDHGISRFEDTEFQAWVAARRSLD